MYLWHLWERCGFDWQLPVVRGGQVFLAERERGLFVLHSGFFSRSDPGVDLFSLCRWVVHVYQRLLHLYPVHARIKPKPDGRVFLSDLRCRVLFWGGAGVDVSSLCRWVLHNLQWFICLYPVYTRDQSKPDRHVLLCYLHSWLFSAQTRAVPVPPVSCEYLSNSKWLHELYCLSYRVIPAAAWGNFLFFLHAWSIPKQLISMPKLLSRPVSKQLCGCLDVLS